MNRRMVLAVVGLACLALAVPAGAQGPGGGLSEGLQAVPSFDLVGNAHLLGGGIDLGPYEMPE